jgi:hypothetical protein
MVVKNAEPEDDWEDDGDDEEVVEEEIKIDTHLIHSDDAENELNEAEKEEFQRTPPDSPKVTPTIKSLIAPN